MMDWRPATEPPAEAVCTAIIGLPPGDDEDDRAPLLLPGIYVWQHGEWRHEDDGRPLTQNDFWWCAERGIVAQLAARIASRRNGHG